MHPRQQIVSELQVLQEAVASAVHELSQPLNVVNLLADNALDDVAALEAGAADPAVVTGLRRRVEAIVEQSGKASDITRWVRAFAVSITAEAADFDPDAVIERIVGLFGNDLRVAGATLVANPEPGRRSVAGNEALLNFALTEAILWISRAVSRDTAAEGNEGTSGCEIHITCAEDQVAGTVVLTLESDIAVLPPGDAATGTSEPAQDGVTLPAALPLLALIGAAPGSQVALVRTDAGGVRIRLVLPRGEWA